MKKNLLKLTVLLLTFIVGIGQMWADNTRVVGVAATNAGNSAVKVKANIGDNNTWWEYTITGGLAGITFEGKKLYIGTMNEKYGGVDALQIYVGSYKTTISGWTTSDNFANDIFNYDGTNAPKYGDVSMTNGARVYFDASTWSETGIKLVTGHANHQKYYALSAVTNTKLYYGTNKDSWSDAMGFGIVGGTSRSGGNDQWLTDVSDKAAEYTGWKNYGLTATGTNNAYLVVPSGNTGEQPTVNYYATAYNSLNSTQTIKYAVGVNGGTPAELTSGYVPADIAISSYKFASGTYSSVSASSGSVTLSQGGNKYNATVTAARTATTTYTVSNIHGDYSFVGWYSAASGGTLLSSELSYTFYPTSATTAYARFSKENNHDVTISRYCTSTSTEINNTSAKIGEVTYSSIEAPDIHGYTFVSWSLGSGVTKHASDALTANPIRVITAASGNYTLTANYTEVLTTDWKLIGDNTTNSPFGDNYNYGSGKAMSKKSGASATDKAYKTLDITKTGTWGFKVATASGNSYTYGWGSGSDYITFNRSKSGNANDVYNGEQHELKFNPDGLGEYEFEVDYTAATCSVKVTFPTVYTVTYSVGSVAGTSGSITATYSSVEFSSGTKIQSGKSVTLTAPAAKTGYTWKGWYTNAAGTQGKITDTNRAITVTVNAPKTLYACYTINNHAITHSAASHGDYTIKVGIAAAVNTNTTADYNQTITLAEQHATGYHWTSWTVTKSPSGSVTVSNNQFAMPNADVTVAATFAANTYQVRFHRNGGSGETVYQNFTYDEAQNLTANTYTRTGYNFAGWALTTDGAVAYANSANVSNLTDENNGTFHLYAKWTAKTTNITLDQTGAASTGSITSRTGTYDSAMPAISGANTLPTAPQGYAFMGYYDQITPTLGTQYYDGSGNSAHLWDKEDATATLYAYFKQAQITAVTVPDAVELAATVNVSATVDPTPAGTTVVCWRLLYNNDNEFATTFTPASDNAVSFTAPSASGTYKVEATLHLNNCEGTTISKRVQSFQVAGEHTVTIRYQDGDGRTLQASTSMTGRPLDWSDEFSAPSVVGYTFNRWEAGDGITITDDNGTTEKTTTTVSAIKMKANYAGNLTAVYTKKDMIYFYNSPGWEHVYVYFYDNGDYWDHQANKGIGAQYDYAINNHSPHWYHFWGEMTRIPGTNVWYIDYQAMAAAIDAVNANKISSYTHVAFTKDAQGYTDASHKGYEYFYSTEAAYRTDFNHSTSMYVPLLEGTINKNVSGSNKTVYYNEGYWMNYPNNSGYKLKIYNSWNANNATGAAREYYFPYSSDTIMPLKLDVEFNDAARHQYWFMVSREDGIYLGAESTTKVTQSAHEYRIYSSNNKLEITTTASGIYTFTLSYYDDNTNGFGYHIDVDYPVSVGDYRILYKDRAAWSKAAHTAAWSHPSDVINKIAADATEKKTDIVSMYIADNSNSPSMKFQYVSAINASTGAVTWNDVAGGTINLNNFSSDITEAGVYNIYLSQAAGGSTIVVDSIKPYKGDYYIRTDVAGSTKWDNYKNHDHMMTYSDYAAAKEGFTHYYAHWVTQNSNVKFVIANDYSHCVSDTLSEDYGTTIANISSGGQLNSGNANIRFMYNESTNKLSRAYISGSGTITDLFLVLEGSPMMYDENGNSLTGENQDHDKYGTKIGTDNHVILHDDENFVYEREIKVNPKARAKLTALYNSNTQYFKGGSGTDAATDSVELLGGTKSNEKYKMRIIYDFKTNRLVTAYMPEGEISGNVEINADMMLIRQHQEAAEQLKFASGGGSLTEVKTVYGVMRFNRWILNNRANPEDIDKDHSVDAATINTYHPVLTSGQKSAYERGLYFISFPFDVNLGDVFGFGTYGVHWILQEYQGAKRAHDGYWKDSPSFWKYITSRTGVTLEAGKGYLLALDLDRMAYNDDEFWTNNIQQVELFFPSKANVGSITQANADVTLDTHVCTIDRRTDKTVANFDKDRRVADSNWNILGVPSYANYNDELTDGSSTITWNSNPRTQSLPFLYEWNSTDNTLSAQSGSNYPFKAMHSYMVQYGGTVHWTLANTTPQGMAARQRAGWQSSYEFRLEIQLNSQKQDQTFVQIRDQEDVTTGFDFNYDLSKEINGSKSNIYTVITSVIDETPNMTLAAGNCLPLETEQVTTVPVGVVAKTSGEYTFAMPDGTEGVSVTLIDGETGRHIDMAIEDYTVELTAGTYDGRFYLQIDPRNAATTIDIVGGEGEDVKAAKIFREGLLYIQRGEKLYDARGSRVE